MSLPTKCLVDTNVPKTANLATQPNPDSDVPEPCVLECINAVEHVIKKRGLIVDAGDEIFNEYRHENITNWLPYHWAVISASYPFWFNVAKHTGRLFNLQDKITQAQVFSRLKEQYGDRETVARNARYAIRSFVAWGVLADAKVKGCYEQSKPMGIGDPNLAILLYEAALYADKEGKAALGLLKNNPAFFPFQMPVLTGDYISQQSNTIDVVRYGLDDELLKLGEHINSVK